MRCIYWWPGRKFRGDNPIPDQFLEDARRRGTKYLTVAFDEVNGQKVYGVAYCCPKDNPSRKMGRRIAVGRLERRLEDVKQYHYR